MCFCLEKLSVEWGRRRPRSRPDLIRRDRETSPVPKESGRFHFSDSEGSREVSKKSSLNETSKPRLALMTRSGTNDKRTKKTKFNLRSRERQLTQASYFSEPYVTRQGY